MANDPARRFADNPILRPADVPPSMPGLTVQCVLNPGAFTYEGKVGLVLRVAEGAGGEEGELVIPVLDPESQSGLRLLRVKRSDPDLIANDPRVITHRGIQYLTTVSHLRLAWSDDGEYFKVEERPMLSGSGPYESYGVEDCRVSHVDGDRYWLTYTAVSSAGVAVGGATTRDWKQFQRLGLLLPPHNKDCAIFEQTIDGRFLALHRPSSVNIGGNYIWLASSPDGIHWGNHQCIARTRPGMWDEQRIGAGAAPIRTDHGWLEIYHGADRHSRYCLGALLLDLEKPWVVLARSADPIMQPATAEERNGFFNECIFTNGHVVQGDRITLYYGAADALVCGATLSLRSVLNSLDSKSI